jgi:hypothetical protein
MRVFKVFTLWPFLAAGVEISIFFLFLPVPGTLKPSHWFERFFKKK